MTKEIFNKLKSLRILLQDKLHESVVASVMTDLEEYATVDQKHIFVVMENHHNGYASHEFFAFTTLKAARAKKEQLDREWRTVQEEARKGHEEIFKNTGFEKSPWYVRLQKVEE